MFESSIPSRRGGGFEALSFIAQQVAATVGSLIISYPIYLDVELGIRSWGDATVLVWRWLALLLPIVSGFVMGLGVQNAWPRAYLSGRFVWILPLIWFFRDLTRSVSDFSFAKSIELMLNDAGGLEMTIGACCYSIGVIVASNRASNNGTTRPCLIKPKSGAESSAFPRKNPFV